MKVHYNIETARHEIIFGWKNVGFPKLETKTICGKGYYDENLSYAIKIEDITCKNCINTLKRRIERIKGLL